MEPKQWALGMAAEGRRLGVSVGTLPLVSRLPQSFQSPPRNWLLQNLPLLGPSTTWSRDTLSFALTLCRDCCQAYTFPFGHSCPQK